MTTTGEGQAELMLHRRFEAPIARVWEAWAQPAQLVQWLGPQGSTMHVIEGEIAAGRTLRVRMEGPMGTMFTAFRYREVVPQRRLVWEHCFADEAGALVRPSFFEVWPLKLLSEATFEEDGVATRVTLRWTPLEATNAEVQAFVEALQGMEAGWGGSFAQLDVFLAA